MKNTKPNQEAISQLLPNTFPFPNFVVDPHPALEGFSIWSCLVGPEQSCLTIMYRKTYGWWKRRDRLALSQLTAMTGIKQDATIRKYMRNLITFGLAIQLTNGSDGLPIEWEVQTDDSQINFEALLKRRASLEELNQARAAKMIGVSSDDRGNVGRNGGGIVGRNGGGIVGRYPQKPLSKANTKTKRSASRNADKMPDRFPVKVESLAVTFMRLTGLKCETKQDYLFWVFGNPKARAKGLEAMRKAGITSNDIEAAINYVKECNRRNPNNLILIKAPNSLFVFADEAMRKRTSAHYQPGQTTEADEVFEAGLNGG